MSNDININNIESSSKIFKARYKHKKGFNSFSLSIALLKTLVYYLHN